MKFLIAAFACASALGLAACHEPKTLFDFNKDPASLDDWVEYSDVQFKNGAGESKASLVFLDNENGREAVFFGLANAKTYSGTALVRATGFWDLSEYASLYINCRADIAQGQFYIVLRHKGINYKASNVYMAKIEATSEFTTIEIPLDSFVSRWVEDEDLDISDITSVGISLKADSGEIDAGILEINWIKAH